MLYTHVAAALAAAAVAFAGGWQVQDWRFSKKEAERQRQATEAALRQDKATYQAASKFEQERTRVETVFQTITETVEVIVERPVYRDTVCFDADGLRAIRDATAQTAAPSPGGAVPTPD